MPLIRGTTVAITEASLNFRILLDITLGKVRRSEVIGHELQFSCGPDKGLKSLWQALWHGPFVSVCLSPLEEQGRKASFLAGTFPSARRPRRPAQIVHEGWGGVVGG
jgi:hypothetical protein